MSWFVVALRYSKHRQLSRHGQLQEKKEFPDQLGKATQRPTARWVFQFFSGIRLLVVSKTQVLGDGSAQRDYTYISDILAGIRGALIAVQSDEPQYEIVNLGESRTVSLRDMIQVLGDEMGITPRITWLPPAPGDVSRTYADVSKARRYLGYDPKVEFREGIVRFLDWFEAEAYG